MVSKEEELKARSVCAWTNFSRECIECPHRELPSGKWINDPRWDYRECEEWKAYLMHPIKKIWDRILCKLHMHDYINYVKIIKVESRGEVRKKCTRCKVAYKLICNLDYTRCKWIRVDADNDTI